MDGEGERERERDDSHLRVGSLVVDQPGRPAACQDQVCTPVGTPASALLRKSLRPELGGIPRGRGRVFVWLIVRPRVVSSRVYTIRFIFAVRGLELTARLSLPLAFVILEERPCY